MLKFTKISYSTTKVLLTSNWVKLINKKEFAKKILLDKNSQTYIIYIVALKAKLLIHLLQITYIATLK